MKTPSDDAIVAAVREVFPDVRGIWLYGSRAAGTEFPDSDLDIAVMLPGRIARGRLWDARCALGRQFGRDIDLVDIRAVGTILQTEAVNGRRLLAAGPDVELYELYIISSRRDWEILMAPLVEDIRRDGRIYG